MRIQKGWFLLSVQPQYIKVEEFQALEQTLKDVDCATHCEIKGRRLLLHTSDVPRWCSWIKRPISGEYVLESPAGS